MRNLAPGIVGGPLHALGRRFRLVDPGSGRTIPLGIAIAGVLWIGIVAFAILDGSLAQVLSVDVIAVHARILAAIPLMFMCESAINPHLARFSAGLVDAGILQGEAARRFDMNVQRFNKAVSSPSAEIACALLAIAVLVMGSDSRLPGVSGSTDAAVRDLGLAGLWYWLVCLTVFRFLVFRWIWRLLLWWLFLWRLSRLEMDLLATHPDRVAGLGYLALVHGTFVSLIAAISVTIAASLAEEIATRDAALRQYYPLITVVLLIDAAVFISPMYFFVSKLRRARARALADYMKVAAGYVNAFDRKWIRGGTSEPMLGSPDIQSLADLASAVGVIEETRIAPLTNKLLIRLAMWALVPFAPLLLFEFPLSSLATAALEMIVGR